MLILPTENSFSSFVARANQAGRLVVQPRMGFSHPGAMRAGLIAVKRAAATTVGTITLDSYTRTGQHLEARRALDVGIALNGYPIVAHGQDVNLTVLRGVHGPGFPVQIRHGSAQPQDIFMALIRAGLDSTEGGPVSYCLPYGRTPLRDSVSNWRQCCELLGRVRDRGVEPHLETFGGCMMGQLCPPGVLVATSVLEALFFRQHGLRSVSLSYAQQTCADQDRRAVQALQHLAGELLAGIDWHIVIYAYMGVYPRTRSGSLALLREAASLAVGTGATRLIVKTASEAFHIPTIAENVQALEAAAAEARQACPPATAGNPADNEVLAEARALVEHVLNIRDDIGGALVEAFHRGYLDVPYCLHPDNRGRSRSYIDTGGWLRWSHVGAMPIAPPRAAGPRPEMTSSDLLDSLTYVQRTFDATVEAGT